jgi:hypothetical protein
VQFHGHGRGRLANFVSHNISAHDQVATTSGLQFRILLRNHTGRWTHAAASTRHGILSFLFTADTGSGSGVTWCNWAYRKPHALPDDASM